MKIAVAFSSPKRAARTIDMAAKQALATNSELILLRIIPDPEKVGVVAQLISSGRPQDKAQDQINQSVKELQAKGIKAYGIVKIGEVAKSIIKCAVEEKADILYVGTTNVGGRHFFMMKKDPIVHYLVDHCPITLCLVRHDAQTEVIVEEQESQELA